MKQISLSIFLIVSALVGLSQQKTIKGRIVNNRTGEALPGATISVKNSKQITTASSDGSFSLAISDSLKSASISHAGFISQSIILTAGIENLLIRLDPREETMDQVIVSTGYETLPKERATGSFSKMDNELFNRTVSTDVLSRLNGNLPAVLFDRRTGGPVLSSIIIRGVSTINANQQPLIVVDNFPYEGDLDALNPNDVESITLLKDAAAASIWGVRAGNGVIVITTKKGGYNQPFRLSINANTTIIREPDLFAVPQMSSSEFIDVEKFLFDKGFYNSSFTASNRPVVTPVVEILQKQKTGLLTAQEANAQIDVLRQRDFRNDQLKYLYRQQQATQLAINLSGGGSQLNYIFSAGYDKNLSSSIGVDRSRLTLRAENTYRPIKSLELNAGVIVGLSLLEGKPGSAASPLTTGSGGSQMYPYARLADELGNPLVLERDYRTIYLDTAGKGRLLNWKYVPLEEGKYNQLTTRSQHYLFRFGARYNVIKNLQAELRYQYEKGTGNTKEYYKAESWFARNLVNRFTQLNGNSTVYIIPMGGILDNGTNEFNGHTVRSHLSYSKNWNSKHQVAALAGVEVRQAEASDNRYRVYGYDDELLTFGPVDYVNRYPIYGNLSSTSFIPNNMVFGSSINRYASLFGNASYTYYSKYILSFSARKDASNIFGVRSNQKAVPLWSTGIAWKISEEKFYNLAWLPYLKLRATYGYSGNVDNSLAAFMTMQYTLGLDPNNGLRTGSVVTPPNPDLRWEKVGMLNFGLDFSALNDRINGSLEYFRKKTVDALGPTPIDITTGIATLTTNSAVLKGYGTDININTRNLDGAIKWTTNLLFSHNRTKVTRYLRRPSNASTYVGRSLTVSPVEGSITHGLYSYAWAGLDSTNGDPGGYLDGKVSKDYTAIRNSALGTLVFHGSALPLYFGSIRNTFSIGGFSISANILFKFDYYFRRKTIEYAALYTASITHSDYSKRWQQQGDEKNTTVPSMNYPSVSNRDDFYRNSEVTVEKGDNIRLQDIRGSWEYQRKGTSKLFFKRMEFYVIASNLGIIWKASKSDADPDFGVNLPPGGAVAVGVKIDF